MNICFLIYNISRSGGSERVTSIIANHLAKKGYNIYILNICGNNTCYYPLDENVKVSTIYNNENVNHKKHYFSILKKIYKFYKSNNIELSIDVFVSLSLFVLPLKPFLKIKNISWEHFNYTAKEGMNKIARKFACRFSNAIVTLTKRDKQEYEKNEKKINCILEYIYNPTPFPNAKKSPLNEKNIITVGRLTYQKGYDLLLKAWQKVELKNKEWNLNIFGTGEDEKMLKDLAEKLSLEKVNFCGTNKKIDEQYFNSSIYVSSSRFEGLPMCMIEAISFGLPIVSFNCKNGPSEIVTNNVNGYLIENNDIDELANKLLVLMEDEKMKTNFSKNIDVSKFEENEIIVKWIDLIQRICGSDNNG